MRKAWIIACNGEDLSPHHRNAAMQHNRARSSEAHTRREIMKIMLRAAMMALSIGTIG